jgi:anti-anti-sigma regulatory factor/HAMP domain-containing protein
MNSQGAKTRFGPGIIRITRDISLQIKLVLLTLGMLSLLLGITIVVTLQTIEQFEEQISMVRLAEERELLAQRLAAEQKTALDDALSLASDPSIQMLVVASDMAALQRLAVPLRIRYQLDYLEIIDLENQSLLGQPSIAGLDEALKFALLSIERSTVVETPQGTMLVAVAPLKDAAGLRGAVLIGRMMNNIFLSQLNSGRGDPIVALHRADGQVVATSTGAPIGQGAVYTPDPDLWKRISSGEAVGAIDIFSNETPYRVMFVPISQDGQTKEFYSIALTTAEIRMLRTNLLYQSILALGAVGLLILLAMLYFMRRFVIRPLTNLGISAEQLGAGQLDIQLEAPSKNEIGRLTASFITMAQQVRQSLAALEQQNQHLQLEIAERIRTEAERSRLQGEVVLAQEAIVQLSTPLISIDDFTIVMPLIGVLDNQRAQQMLEVLLHGVEKARARVVILDITGVALVDEQVARALLSAARAVRLLGAQVVLTGVRPEVAQGLVSTGADLSDFVTYSAMRDGIAYSLQRRAHTV